MPYHPQQLTILQVNRHSPGGGGSKQAFHLALALQRRGHRVLFLAAPDERWRKRCDEAGLPLAFLPMHGRFNLVMAARVAALIKRHGAQVVHAHKGREQALAFWASFFTQIPALVANRGMRFRVGRLRALKYRFRTDAVVVVSEAMGRELIINHETGLLVPPCAPEHLAAGILTLIRSPAQAVAIGWAGRRLVARQFSHDAKAERMERLYLDILRRKGYLRTQRGIDACEALPEPDGTAPL